ncbi:metal ABC transporter substrate-binding protein [Marinactinospora thermotolerans]|uniref:Manganese transport system substrate-binding protein n=1 Tax=Marinactinospora thermotolerans DSM 45154 TaxID=1122192 RepID=A0A1T4PSS8_9ACTN|nr:metal ABC transporter substrate-binding protein [Marinactinospora thermotolerans]SJZ94630.1 manganese transport system substrate-binding protein [Marinactinospora thermotolerans DSM 45154]
MPNIRDWPAFTRVAAATSLASALLSCAACSGASSDSADDGELKVLTTFTVLADMARNVAGEGVTVESITRPGAEIHEYEPTPDDLVRGQGADLILDNGLGLERWFEQFTDQVDAPSATLSDGVETIPISSGSYRGQANPHAWMSPANALIYVDNIATALGEIDPANAETYTANAETYKAEIGEIDTFLTEELSALPHHRRALVTCEGAFSYLARDAGLQERYLWPVNADSEGTPQQIAAVVSFVRDNEVPAVFCESTVNDGAQRQVARETGAEFGGSLYVDSLSDADGPVPTYLDLLRHDAETIVAGLTASESTEETA